jgi:hypothetical protein
MYFDVSKVREYKDGGPGWYKYANPSHGIRINDVQLISKVAT